MNRPDHLHLSLSNCKLVDSHGEPPKFHHVLELLQANWSSDSDDHLGSVQALKQLGFLNKLRCSLREIKDGSLNNVNDLCLFYDCMHVKRELESLAYKNVLWNVEQIYFCHELLTLHSPVLTSANDVSSSYVVVVNVLENNLNAFSSLGKKDLFVVFIQNRRNHNLFLSGKQGALHSLLHNSDLNFSKQLNVRSVHLFGQHGDSQNACLGSFNCLNFIKGVKQSTIFVPLIVFLHKLSFNVCSRQSLDSDEQDFV